MKCRNCGGEILFKAGQAICQSCGGTLKMECVHENIDVYICYEENDASGRRTKDSVIAQEVYKKLEAAKISAFYERISADGAVGEDLEAARYAAMQRAKTVLVLGASPENFQAIVGKFGFILEQKTVIPFCVDINPGAIPKAISKIQAINYSTIGWDQDLIKGLYNLLGREKELDTKTLFGKRKKKKAIAICVVTAIVLLLVAAVLIFVMPGGENNTETQVPTQAFSQATEASSEQEQTTEVGPSPNEIYAQAVTAMDEGRLVEALDLFSQIPEHKDSSNKIKLIFAKYEGYYKNGDISMHLDITDNFRADVEVLIASEGTVARFSESTTVTNSTIAGGYRDNFQQTGTFEVVLEDACLRLTCYPEGASKIETQFALAERSDKPFLQLDRETLLSWLESKLTFEQIRQMGYELEPPSIYDRAGGSLVYKMKDAEIFLSMFNFDLEGSVLTGVQAPAWMLTPSYIGSESVPFLEGDLIYWPNGFLTGLSEDMVSFWTDSQASAEIISEDTLIGITSKKVLSATAWDDLRTDFITTKVEMDAARMYDLQLWVDYCDGEILTENDTHLLLTVNTSHLLDAQMCAWYKVSKNDYEVSFLRVGSYQEEGYKIAENLWFNEYSDFATEFPALYGLPPEEPPTDSEEPSTGSNEVPYTILIEKNYYFIQSAPDHWSDNVASLPAGSCTIIEEYYDEYGHLWGKVESGEGWICITDILTPNYQ